jgi:hypothetical protein
MHMRHAWLLAIFLGCSSKSGPMTPEQAASGAKDGQHVVVIGTVHTVTFDSIQVMARKAEVAEHAGDMSWLLEEDTEEATANAAPPYNDTENYRRTPDHYILIRSKVPPDVVQGQPGFTPGALAHAWGLGIHLTDIDPAVPMPEIGAQLKVTGTFHQITWNSREITLPIIDDATIEVLDPGPAPLAGPGEPCTLDQACNARLVCDRTSQTCVPTAHEIYWDDPWHDVNGACDSDADCPLGQVCNLTYAIPATGTYAPQHETTDIGRHLCLLAPGSTLASQCPRIYTARDLAGGRFASGKEICVRSKLLLNMVAADNDTHDQIHVDEPIPYPTDDSHYELFGAVTENGPMFKDPTLPGGPVMDPTPEQDIVAVGTYRYDPGHGWYEMHPVKAYFPPPP